MMHAVINHLWQSTVFAILAGLLTLAFRRNRAQVRYWLWFSASVKFLIPFALLLSLGGYLGRSPVAKSLPVPAISYAVVQLAEPFPVHAPAAPPAQMSPQTPIDWIPIVLVSLWMCGFLGVTLSRFRAWLRIRAALRLSTLLEIPFPVPVRSTTHLLEPGVVGFFRPSLLLPAGIRERLTPEQLQGVLTHELCHLRRRDNLTATIHMIVEALFWFHPLVWWISARLMEERERACDEAVLELGSKPQIYAESILKICQLCVKSPLACVPGIAGADLKKRVGRIMTQRTVSKVGVCKSLLLAMAGFLAIAVPIGFGLARPNAELGSAPAAQSARTSEATGTLSAPEFEVASIRPAKPNGRGVQVMLHLGGFTATNVTAKMLIAFAYNSDQTGMWLSSDQLSSGPKWISSERFDIEAKVPDSLVHHVEMKVPADQWIDQIRLMVQSMLAERFKLKVSHETKEMRVYALVVTKHGPKLIESKLPPLGPGRPGSHRRGLDITGRGNVSASWATIGLLAGLLSRQPEVGGRVVLDQTRLKGHYDFTLKWTPETESGQFPSGPGPGGVTGAGKSAIAAVGGGQSVAGIRAALDSSGPSLFTALQQQLGLKLEPAKGPVKVLVIDHIEPPTPN